MITFVLFIRVGFRFFNFILNSANTFPFAGFLLMRLEERDWLCYNAFLVEYFRNIRSFEIWDYLIF